MQRLILFILIIAVVFGCAAPKPPMFTPEQRQKHLESFDYVWETIRDKHWDQEFGGVDWGAVRDELRPRIEAAFSKAQVRQVLDEMISRLDQSHFNIVSGEVYEQMKRPTEERSFGGAVGMDIRIIDDQAIVTKVEPGSPAGNAGIRPGWQIVSIETKSVEDMIKPVAEEYEGRSWKYYVVNSVVSSRLTGSVGDSVRVTFLDGSDEEILHTLILVEQKGKMFQIGYFPPFYVWFESKRLDGDIGYIAFNAFMDPGRIMPAFNEAMESHLDAEGVIIDLRGNPGGIIAMSMGMAGWFVEEKGLRLGTITMRDNVIKAIVFPRSKVYSGPVAILVDGLSGSNSEILAGGMKDLGRARVFGSQTAGAVLPSAFEALPNGDGFQYAFANYESAAGSVLEGVGVFPDVEIYPTREALLEGRDLVLETAQAWIKGLSDKTE